MHMPKLKSMIEPAAAAAFLALPPYGLAAHWYGAALMAVTALPACGMALLLTRFGRRELTPVRRALPVAAGWIALLLVNRCLAGAGTIWSSLFLTLSPLAVALTVMPGSYFLIYSLERARETRFEGLNRIVNHAALPLGAVALMALAALFPQVGGELMLRPDSGLFPGGWRLLSCHFVHFGWEHFFWDSAVLFAAGTMLVGCRGRLFFSRLLLAAAFWVGLAVALTATRYSLYCGSSGLGTACVAALAVHFIRSGGGVLRGVSSAVLTGIVCKAGFEMVSGQPLFVSGSEFEPVAVAHLAGALTGAWLALPRHRLRVLRGRLLRHCA